MKTLSQTLAQKAIADLAMTDKLYSAKQISQKILVGFNAEIQTELEMFTLLLKLTNVCDKHYQFKILNTSSDSYEIKIVAKDYVIDQGGIFHKSVLSLVKGLIEEEITFKKINNIYE